MSDNRIIDFVNELNQSNETNMDHISKLIREKFGASFRLTRAEADHLSLYLQGKLNFNCKIIDFKTLKQITS